MASEIVIENKNPCIECDRPGCEAAPKIAREFARSVDLTNAEGHGHQWYWPNRLIEASLDGLAKLYSQNKSFDPQPEIALPAIFDLVVNASFAAGVTDSGWVYCLGHSGKFPPKQYYSFVGMCPRCGFDEHYYPARAHKPTSARIGDASSATLTLLWDKVIRHNAPGYKLFSTANQQGDADIFIVGEDILAMGEIKASPLITYPLEIALTETLTTETDDGETILRPNHEQDSPRVVGDAHSISLYIPQSNLRIDLGAKSGDGWPFGSLIKFVQEPDNLQAITNAWEIAYQAYSERDRNNPTFYLNHGCGKKQSVSISDSKNAPGVDRTDDIKKGTYQLLKYGAYYSEKCERRLVRSVLLGNIHAVVHEKQYVSDLEDVVWTKERLKHDENSETITWKRENLFNLFDGLMCLSKITTRDTILKRLFDLEAFSKKFIAKG